MQGPTYHAIISTVKGGKKAYRPLWQLLGCLSCAAALVGCKSSPKSEKKSGPPALAREDADKDAIHPHQSSLASLLAFEDTDGDKRITVLDEGPSRFTLRTETGESREVRGTSRLANLVQELYLAHSAGKSTISWKRINEPTFDRISRQIREQFWKNLTRTIDTTSIETVVADSKASSPKTGKVAAPDDWPEDCTPRPKVSPHKYLYVPHSDEKALGFYQRMVRDHPALVVCRLPAKIIPEWVNSLSASETHESRHGLLSLALRQVGDELQPVPYVVPGGRFNELYGWDSYFHVLGLINDGLTGLARDVVDNQLYEIRHYGKVLNANRTYYLNRSQPPFLSAAVRGLWEALTQKDDDWLTDAVETLTDEYNGVWRSPERLTPLCRPVEGGEEKVCLSTYHASGLGEPPEVEPGHFDWMYEERASRVGLDAATFREKYLRRTLPFETLQALDRFFMHDRSMRESGHDTTYRWFTEDGDRCADFATIDLNSLLFRYELDLAKLSKDLGKGDWKAWCARASARRDLVQEHLYNGNLFVDYRLKRDAAYRFSGGGEQSESISATTLFPLWASVESPCTTSNGTPLQLVTGPDQVKRLVEGALSALEEPGGLAATARTSVASVGRTHPRQWDYPFGWAPHQILAWVGLQRFGRKDDVERLVYRWLYMITKNADDYHGTVPEKFDVVRRSHEVFAEYGNVGTEFSYITREGFGWMNASFQVGSALLPEETRSRLRALVPPEN